MVQLLILGFRRDCLHLKVYHRLRILPARRLDLPTLIVSFGAKHQTCPHSAAHAPWLIEMVVGHPSLQGLRRFVFVTRDDHGFTSAAGFARRPARGDMEWHR